MAQPVCGQDAATEEFLTAKLNYVRRCPARADYLELIFTTKEGFWKWCFSDPRPEPGTGELPRAEPGAMVPLALTVGRYGAQARPRGEDGELGPALTNAEALPLILAGTKVSVTRKLVERGR